MFPSELPIVDFVDTWTFVTVFTSRHLSPNIWECSTIDWFTFLVYFQGGQYPLVEFDWFTFFWFTSREGSTNWLWFTLVYLQTIDGLLIFSILLVYSGLLGL